MAGYTYKKEELLRLLKDKLDKDCESLLSLVGTCKKLDSQNSAKREAYERKSRFGKFWHDVFNCGDSSFFTEREASYVKRLETALQNRNVDTKLCHGLHDSVRHHSQSDDYGSWTCYDNPLFRGLWHKLEKLSRLCSFYYSLLSLTAVSVTVSGEEWNNLFS